MSNDHLQCEPHDIDNDSWWYENESGIFVVIQVRGKDGQYIDTVSRVIKWSAIRPALKRKDRKP